MAPEAAGPCFVGQAGAKPLSPEPCQLSPGLACVCAPVSPKGSPSTRCASGPQPQPLEPDPVLPWELGTQLGRLGISSSSSMASVDLGLSPGLPGNSHSKQPRLYEANL